MNSDSSRCGKSVTGSTEAIAPLLSAMEDAQYPNFVSFGDDLIDEEIGRTANDSFARVGDLPGAAHMRKLDQQSGR